MSSSGVLAIWHNIDASPEMAREIFEWYNREHHNERFDVPGFTRARRYAVVEGNAQIFCRYDTVDPGVLSSSEYLHCVNHPSPWTQRTMPHYRNMSRTVCGVDCRFGLGEGGKLATLRIDALRGTDIDELARCVRDDVIPQVERAQSVIGGQLLRAVDAVSGIGSTEKNLRGDADELCELALLISGSDLSDVQQASQWACEKLIDAGASVEFGLYELVFDRSDVGVLDSVHR